MLFLQNLMLAALILTVCYYLYITFIKSSTGISSGYTPVSNVISHWSHFFQSFALSSNDFYTKLEAILQSHEMPHIRIIRTTHKEAGILSASREYLRIKHGEIVFDICAAPFGKDFFISWWLYESHGMMRTMLRKTKVGDFLNARAQKRTFYQIDEEDMFRSCVHECVLEAIEAVSEGRGVTLTKEEKAFKMGL